MPGLCVRGGGWVCCRPGVGGRVGACWPFGIYGRIEKHTARVIVCRVSCVLYVVVDVFPVAGGGRVGSVSKFMRGTFFVRVRSFTVPRCSVFVVGRSIVLHQY